MEGELVSVDVVWPDLRSIEMVRVELLMALHSSFLRLKRVTGCIIVISSWMRWMGSGGLRLS